ncbi:MAG: hypothetical protein H6698_06175 [Myxococcales bacterium]|nr:hypothetical protein [Myxococcales bacterium]
MFGLSLQPRHRLFSVFGVPVFADTSALALLAIVLWTNGRGGPSAIVGSLLLAAVVFVSLVGHELGHALMIRARGYGRSDIILGGLGGVCRWQGSPTRGDMIRIALAGPAVSLGLAAVSGALHAVTPVGLAAGLPAQVLRLGLIVNLVWGVFNLIPIYPMDGGRALRSALAFRYSMRDATRRSLQVSFACGVAAIGLGVFVRDPIAVAVVALLLFQNWREWDTLR